MKNTVLKVKDKVEKTSQKPGNRQRWRRGNEKKD